MKLLLTLLVLAPAALLGYMGLQYRTLDSCAAAGESLTRATMVALSRDIRAEAHGAVAGSLASTLIRPLAEPVVRSMIENDLRYKSWIDCAATLVRLDLLGGRDRAVEDLVRQAQ